MILQATPTPLPILNYKIYFRNYPPDTYKPGNTLQNYQIEISYAKHIQGCDTYDPPILGTYFLEKEHHPCG